MKNLIQQYTDQLEKLIEEKDDDKFAGPTLLSSQLVMPTIAWDWSPAPVGMMLNSSFEFADTMPVSCQTETYYQPSANSFTNNYRNFLSLLQVTSQPINRLVKKARRKIAVPAGSPANNPTPPGWTIVKINGLNRWCPIWNFSDTAYDWLKKVQTGRINNPGTIVIKLRKNSHQRKLLKTKKPGSSVTKPFNSNIVFEKVVIEASSWGQISISPGSWYDSAIISLTAGDLSPALRSKFFGHKGLLACRLASFYVAYQVKITFYGHNIDQLAQKNLNTYSYDILALGIQVKPAKKQVAGSLQFSGVLPDPVIVAVALEKMNPMAKSH